ncbi:ribbon-helix-helix domain-containing protein [Gloeocapsopsis dulcis]|uniref:ribbon-helix-helix domain-containing protein n=1 Tax=Gloeocapsopsis dulcis TaxID=2859516 RepID=UPI0039C8B2C5
MNKNKRFTDNLNSIRVKPEQHEALKVLSEKWQTSLSHLVRLAIVEFLEKHGVDV